MPSIYDGPTTGRTSLLRKLISPLRRDPPQSAGGAGSDSEAAPPPGSTADEKLAWARGRAVEPAGGRGQPDKGATKNKLPANADLYLYVASRRRGAASLVTPRPTPPSPRGDDGR